MIRILLAVLLLAAGTVAECSALKPPEGRKIRVAVVLTEGAVVIDYAGPWEVFENVHLGTGDMDQAMPFELYTVSRDRKPIHTSGGMKPGMTVVPDYGFADAPAPDVVVVGAQSGDPELGPWLRKVHEQHALIMSVCTGAFRVAETGLLDGKPATTHHASLQRLANQYPRIAVRSSVRYVESDPLILTAGGLSSGIDSALHVVELYYGREVAQATADYMEYQGQGWKTNAGAGEPKEVRPTIPLAYRDRETRWQGTFLPAYPRPEPAMPLTLHLAQVEGQYRGTLDAPTESMIGEPLDDVQVADGRIHFTLGSDHGPVDFTGTMTADRISGNVTHAGGTATPLTLTRAGPVQAPQ
ncbi:MAG TPA: DJ-1/PfpI family protein [Steroidobacteraceae bacterium]|nr:DJ-1/PfpI family protein [Steroidobacteraceae bacterium]